MRALKAPSALFLLLASCPAWAVAADWPAWRGPQGNGTTPETDLPLKWTSADVRWKVDLPGPGNSSPIACRDRVFITQALDRKGSKRALMCFRRTDGKLLWQGVMSFSGEEPTHSTNPYCAATPVTDGERVIACFGSAGTVCYDLEGKELWRHDLGKLLHIWGNASSPILYRDLAIFWCGPGERQFLLALNKSTGKQVWRRDEPGGKFGKEPKDWLGSWCTPIVAKVGDHDELIVAVPHILKGFDPATGKELWHCDGMGPLVYASPVCSADGIVVAFSGYHGPAMAVRAGGKGDVTKTHRLWHLTKDNPQTIGSPVLVGRHVYLVREPGLGQCFELETGKEVWGKKRVCERTWTSLIRLGNRLCIAADNGEMIAVAATPRFQELTRSNIAKEETKGSLAAAEGAFFLRTYRHLWCIEKAATRAQPSSGSTR